MRVISLWPKKVKYNPECGGEKKEERERIEPRIYIPESAMISASANSRQQTANMLAFAHLFLPVWVNAAHQLWVGCTLKTKEQRRQPVFPAVCLVLRPRLSVYFAKPRWKSESWHYIVRAWLPWFLRSSCRYRKVYSSTRTGTLLANKRSGIGPIRLCWPSLIRSPFVKFEAAQ